jgi:molecular chaperone GrpE (heat shock protein)
MKLLRERLVSWLARDGVKEEKIQNSSFNSNLAE